jgi:hypothetical protein
MAGRHTKQAKHKPNNQDIRSAGGAPPLDDSGH